MVWFGAIWGTWRVRIVSHFCQLDLLSLAIFQIIIIFILFHGHGHFNALFGGRGNCTEDYVAVCTWPDPFLPVKPFASFREFKNIFRYLKNEKCKSGWSNKQSNLSETVSHRNSLDFNQAENSAKRQPQFLKTFKIFVSRMSTIILFI